MKPSTSLILVGLTLVSQGRAQSSWSDVSRFFVFGDSYTQTGFNVSLEQPNPENPLGNPPYPGWTSSNGPNWIDFLSTTHNASYVQTYNLAYGGATVDSDLVPPYEPEVQSMKYQVEELFVPTYGAQPPSTPWTGADSLFAFFIGINDVGSTYWTEYDSLYDEIFAVYLDLVDQVYQTGGRNFLFINVPPVDRSPLTVEEGEESQALEDAAIQDFNTRISELASGVEKTYNGSLVFQFDSHTLYTEVLDDPTSHVETAVYKNLTDFCEEYQDGTPDWYTSIPSCGVAVNEYFWLNNLHPTFPVHNATASGIAEMLGKEW